MQQKKTEPIRILHVVTNMSYGGLENLLMNYYRNIDRSKIQFDFLTHVDIHQDFEEEIELLGGRIYRLPRLNPFSFGYLNKLDSFFRDHPEYKIVHSHLDCLAAIPLRAAQKAGVPVRIAHSHGSNQNHNLKYLIKLYYKRLIPSYATDLFACGKEAGDWMFVGKPYTIMRNAIDAKAFRFSPSQSEKIRTELGLNNSFVLGHVGQFRQEKNHLFLIEVFAQLLKLESDSRLVLVGRGPQMEAAIAKAEEMGIRDRILFMGARSDIPDLMQVMDVFALPSVYEGLPVTMVEAQAAGLPCVISTGVPIECKLTERVEQVALAEGPKQWAETIMKYRNEPRRDNYNAIAESGFDIIFNVKWLEEYYYNAHNRH